MKRRTVKDEKLEKPSLRRTTRASNKSLANSTRTDTAIPVVHVVPDVATPGTTPSRHVKNHDRNNETNKSNVDATPKSGKCISFYDRETPLKEDVFLSSQQDSSLDVGWDCTSPDALRYIQKQRRRRHVSDVSDIVQKLLVPGEDHTEDEEPPDRQSLLQLWMDSDTHERKDSGHDQEMQFRGGKRKEKRSNPERSSSLSKALMEKLQLALKKCEDDGSPTNSPVHQESSSRVAAKQHDLHQSKDLFENSAEAMTQDSQNESRSDKHGKIVQSDDSWSDDDFFSDNSLIIKATQEVEQCTNLPKGQAATKKRKSSEGNPLEEPPSKSVKLSKSDNLSNNISHDHKPKNAIVSKTSLFKTTNLKSSRQNSQSPFRKCKSFEDSRRKVDSSSASQIPHFSKERVNHQNNFVRMQYDKNAVKPPIPSHLNQQKKLAQNISQNFQKHRVNSRVNDIKDIPTSNMSKDCTSTTTSLGPMPRKFPGAGSGWQSGVTTGTNINKTTNVVQTNLKSPNCDKYSHVNNRNVTPNLRKKMCDTKGSPFSPHLPNSRRISGTFDTSLSDDLLCQLAEPDEILESQASQVPKNETKQQDFVKNKKSSLSSPGNGRNVTFHPISQSQNLLPCKSSIISKPSGALPSHAMKTSPSSIVCSAYSSGATAASVTASSHSATSGTCANATSITSVCQSAASCTNVNTKTASHTAPSHTNVAADDNKQNRNLTQQGKYTFKTKSPPGISQSCDGKNIPFKNDKPDKNATNPKKEKAWSKSSVSTLENSEDLFNSDEDELSEPQILALLDTVELQATQNENFKGKCVKEFCETEAEKKESDSPVKCTPDEIQRKKEEALKKRHAKVERSGLPDTENLSQSSNSNSPFKCTPEEIDQKKIAAIERRRQRSGSLSSDSKQFDISPIHNMDKDTNISLDRQTATINTNSCSPFKCSPSEIEQKKLTALARRRQKSGTNIYSPSNLDSVSSPPKANIQEEIERKKLAALKRREERQKASRNLDTQVFSNLKM